MSKHLWSPLILLSALTATVANAQPPAGTPSKAEARWSIALSAGPAIPTGSFVPQKVYPQYGNGYTSVRPESEIKTGIGAELSLGFLVAGRFRLVAALSAQRNSGNPLGWQDTTTNLNNASSPAHPNTHWRMVRWLGGGEYALPLKKSPTTLFLRALAGAQKTRSPDYTVYFSQQATAGGGVSPGQPPYQVNKSYPGVSLPWTFAWEGDAGVEYRLAGRLLLTVSAGYSGSSLSRPMSEVLALSLGNTVIASDTQKVNITTATLHIKGGLTYDL